MVKKAKKAWKQVYSKEGKKGGRWYYASLVRGGTGVAVGDLRLKITISLKSKPITPRLPSTLHRLPVILGHPLLGLVKNGSDANSRRPGGPA